MVNLADGMVVTLMHRASRTCLDVTNWGGSGTPVIGYGCHGELNQQWELKRLQPNLIGDWDLWNLVNMGTKTLLDLHEGGKGPGTPITANTQDSFPNPNQEWRLVTARADSDVVMIQNVGSGTYVNLAGGRLTQVTGEPGMFGDQAQSANKIWEIQVVPTLAPLPGDPYHCFWALVPVREGEDVPVCRDW